MLSAFLSSMSPNAGLEMVKRPPEMAPEGPGSNSIRRNGGVLQQFGNGPFSGDFCSTCQALLTANGAFDDDRQAGEMPGGKLARGSDEKHGGFAQRLLLDIPVNGAEAAPQTMTRPFDLPTRTLQRSGAPIGRGPSVLVNRIGKESRRAETARHELKLPPAQTRLTAERIPAPGDIASPVAIPLPETAGQSPAVSSAQASPRPESMDNGSPTRETREFALAHSNLQTIFSIRDRQEARPEDKVLQNPAVPESRVSLPDVEIKSRASAVRETPTAPSQNGAPATTDADSHEGKERAAAEAMRGHEPHKQAPALSPEKEMSGSNSVHPRTAKGAFQALPERLQIRARQASPNVSGLRVQTSRSANSSMQLRSSDHQHLGSEMVRDFSTMHIESPRDIPEVAHATPRSSGANSSGGEVLAALDADRADSAQTWVRAGRHEAEAGYQDPELGWVTVRARAATSGIHAALVPGSMEAALPLSDHLAGLNAYLADHHAGVHPVSVSSPEVARDDLSAGQGMNQGPAQGDGRDQSSGSGGAQPGPARRIQQDATSNTQSIDAIGSPTDFGRQRGTINLVV